MAQLAHPVLVGAPDLGRERPLADPGHIRLCDADHPVDPVRTDANARCSVRRDRVRGGHERIRAVIEVEERRLCSFEEDDFPVAQHLVDVQGRVGDVRAHALCVALILRRNRLEVERLRLVDAHEPQVLLGERDLDLLPQDLRVEDVLDADPEPHCLVGVARPDAAPGRADCELPEPALARLVDRQVPRHDQVGVAREVDLRGVLPAALELVEFSDQDFEIDDAAVADHARLAAHDPARQCTYLVRLVADHDRVPGVRPALVAADHVRVLREQVDDLALPFVAPLRPDDDGRRHVTQSRLRPRLPQSPARRAPGDRGGRGRCRGRDRARAGPRTSSRRSRSPGSP